MKRLFRRKWIYISVISALLISAMGAAFLCACRQSSDEYLRLHIRANSNATCDQQVKLAVRDAVVAYLTPLANGVTTKRQMQDVVEARLHEVEQIADDVLHQNGYDYRSHAYLSYERFPEKTYGDLTLTEGYYDAVIVELGTGEGDNWWCVAFPPLCFVAAEDTPSDEIVYRSVIAEWFRTHCH